MNIYDMIKNFKKKYPMTIAFRLKKHCDVLFNHLNEGEKVLYAFCGQKNYNSISLPNTFVIALTNKRLIFARKRLLFGSFFYSVTPDMYNDLKANSGILWGKIIIDTVKEVAVINNLDKKSLDEVETAITEYMIREKQKYAKRNDSK